METALMIILVIIFGIWSIIRTRYNTKSIQILDLTMISISLAILIFTALTVEEKRYLAIVFILLGLNFILKKIKGQSLKN